MVLSLPFILAFIGASVALLIGIVIFTEVTDAMALTLPTLSSGLVPVIIPDVTEATPQMFFKEHNPAGTANLAVANNVGGIGTFLTDNHSGANGVTGYIFIPNIDAEYVNGLEATVGWEGACLTGSGTMHGQLLLWDGNYDGTSATVFPSGSARQLLGNGQLQQIYINSDVCGGGQFGGLTRSGALLNTTDATFETVTLVASLTSPNGQSDLGVTQITVIDYAGWSTGGSAMCSTITATKTGTTTDEWECTAMNGLTVDPLAQNATRAGGVPSTDAEIQQVETFNNALAIGFTVIGILPVALFFALFAIFSSLTGGRSGS